MYVSDIANKINAVKHITDGHVVKCFQFYKAIFTGQVVTMQKSSNFIQSSIYS